MTEEKKDLTDKPLDKMTVTELREVAKEIPNITGVHGMKKPELLAAIKQDKGIEDEPRKKTGPPKPKVSIPKATLKAMIRDLKTKRRQALEEKDKQMAERYRRKISKLKKKTRQAA
ncbi:MAG: Rho termination factor N-terminal domain-containing protein [Desulfobacteraceae bacterium]